MTGTPNADAALQAIRGGEQAHQLVRMLHDGIAPADGLLEALEELQAAEEPERLRGFCRALSKLLERGA